MKINTLSKNCLKLRENRLLLVFLKTYKPYQTLKVRANAEGEKSGPIADI